MKAPFKPLSNSRRKLLPVSGLMLAGLLAPVLAACGSTGPAVSTSAGGSPAAHPASTFPSALPGANSAAGKPPAKTPSGSASGATAASSSAAAGSGGAAPPSNGQAVPVNPQSDVGATTKILNPGVVSWVHFGDLHITTADQQNYADLKSIISQTNQYLKNGVNFALLPGDNANDDTESEYQLIKQATDGLQVPLYAVPGDHDHKSGLTNYNKYMEPVDYQSFSAGGYHFAFLDVMSGISSSEKTWLTNDLAAATKAGLKNVLFMHSYSAATQLQDLIQQNHVILVDSGHTHYNAVANDGHTIYAAGRNTGQVTEGPVGFTMITLDNGVVSWKFKPLGSWPFVMITSPSEKLLMTDGSQVVKGTTAIRAKIWDDKGVASATMQVDGGTAVAMQRIGDTQMWSAPFDSTKVSDGDHKIKVNVTGAGGNTSEDEIAVVVNQSGSYAVPQRQFGPANNDIGTYTEKGLLGNHSAGGPGGKPAPGAGGPGGKPAPGTGGQGGKPAPGPGGPKGTGGGASASGPVGLTGVIQSLNGNTLTLQLPNGSQQQITVAGGTQIVKESSGASSDLKSGETVDVKVQPASSPSGGGGGSSSSSPSPSGSSVAATASQIAIHG